VEFTGERYVPSLDWPEISYEHWHRYLYASQFVSRKEVLDIACGEGYGVSLLADTANHIFGVDMDPETIKHARATYPRPNIDFRCGSADSIPIPGRGVFDVVVSFETIEHLDMPNQIKFARELKRLLKPEGIAIISTPNKTFYRELNEAENPYHLQEFSHEEFVSLLTEYFKSVLILGQRVYPGSYIWPTSGRSRSFTEYQLAFSGGRFTPLRADEKELYYMIALCSDADNLKRSGSILLDISERSTAFRAQQLADQGRAIQEFHERIVVSDRTIQELQARLREQTEITQREREIADEKADELRRELTNQLERVEVSQRTIQKLHTQLTELTDAAQREKEIAAWEADELRREMTEQVDGLVARVESLQAHEDELAKLVLDAHEQLLHRDQEILPTVQRLLSSFPGV
jgi:O-antigen biosynthesis protein